MSVRSSKFLALGRAHHSLHLLYPEQQVTHFCFDERMLKHECLMILRIFLRCHCIIWLIYIVRMSSAMAVINLNNYVPFISKKGSRLYYKHFGVIIYMLRRALKLAIHMSFEHNSLMSSGSNFLCCGIPCNQGLSQWVWSYGFSVQWIH